MSISDAYLIVYSLMSGTMIAAMWVQLVCSGNVPELRDGRERLIGHHIAAELLTAALLVMVGAALAVGYTVRGLALIPLGMLLYTIINSAGHYAQIGNDRMVGAFYVMVILKSAGIAAAIV